MYILYVSETIGTHIMRNVDGWSRYRNAAGVMTIEQKMCWLGSCSENSTTVYISRLVEWATMSSSPTASSRGAAAS